MKRWGINIAIILIYILVVVDFVRNIVENDAIHFFTDRPQRLLLVAAIAGVGGLLVCAFSRLPIAVRRALFLFLTYVAALLVAYLIAWVGALIYLSHSAGEPVRWELCWMYLLLAWTPNESSSLIHALGFGKLLNHAVLFSFVGFIPLAGLALVLVRRLGREKNDPV